MTPREREALAASLAELHSACVNLARLRRARPRLRRVEAGRVREPAVAGGSAPALDQVLSTTLGAFIGAQNKLRQRGLALSRTAPVHVRMHGELCELDTRADVARVRLQLQRSPSPETREAST